MLLGQSRDGGTTASSCLSDALEELERRKQSRAQVVIIQVLKATHQMVVDQGGWWNSSLLIRSADACGRQEFGASADEISMISTYRKNLYELKELQGGQQHRDQQDKDQERRSRRRCWWPAPLAPPDLAADSLPSAAAWDTTLDQDGAGIQDFLRLPVRGILDS